MTDFLYYVAAFGLLSAWFCSKVLGDKKKQGISILVMLLALALAMVFPDKSKYSEEANKEFASHLGQSLNNDLSAAGVSDRVTVDYNGAELLYIYLPQEYKYASNSQIQKISDDLMIVKNNLFTKWVLKNGYKTEIEPKLYINASDGTTLAVENRFNGRMDRKVSN